LDAGEALWVSGFEGLGPDHRPSEVGLSRATDLAGLEREDDLGHVAAQIDARESVDLAAAKSVRVDRALRCQRFELGAGPKLGDQPISLLSVLDGQDPEGRGPVELREGGGDLLFGRLGLVGDLDLPDALECQLVTALFELLRHRGLFVHAEGPGLLADQDVVHHSEHQAVDIEVAALRLRGRGVSWPS